MVLTRAAALALYYIHRAFDISYHPAESSRVLQQSAEGAAETQVRGSTQDVVPLPRTQYTHMLLEPSPWGHAPQRKNTWAQEPI